MSRLALLGGDIHAYRQTKRLRTRAFLDLRFRIDSTSCARAAGKPDRDDDLALVGLDGLGHDHGERERDHCRPAHGPERSVQARREQPRWARYERAVFGFLEYDRSEQRLAHADRS